MKIEKIFTIPERWALHAYYTLNPFAPDGSGRLLLAAADLASRTGEILILDSDGKIVDSFGKHPVESMFFHTGFWQTWSPDARFVYYQSGSLAVPAVTRRELATGRETVVRNADMEGAPPDGEPLVGGLPGLLYAAGYGYGRYNPAIAPVPFERRDRHGIFEFDFTGAPPRLRLSTADFLDCHPDRNELLKLDRELAVRNGTPTGLTLMCYCVRWSPTGERMMIHFGNHCVVPERQEPRLSFIYTCKRDFSDLKMALSIGGCGVHWSFHPDGRHLVGYYRTPPGPASVWQTACDGSGLQPLFGPDCGGHPSVSPLDARLGVTDRNQSIEFWDISTNRLIEAADFGNTVPGHANSGSLRNEFRVCHHPVFVDGGRSVLFNVLDEKHCYLVQVAAPGV